MFEIQREKISKKGLVRPSGNVVETTFVTPPFHHLQPSTPSKISSGVVGSSSAASQAPTIAPMRTLAPKMVSKWIPK